ncbi:MAG TPA: type III pantothenate kinase [Chitinophagaceae bacterium]|nr:type III pantothenate kinase [Chitinophagaceae bacterium]
MSITFCFDFGNTRKKLAIFRDAAISEMIVLPDDSSSTIQPLIDQHHPAKSILSSVIDHDPAMETLLGSQTKFHKLSHLTKIPFTTPVGKPETIGADRLALAAAAVHFYPKKNNLVIGLGTCITYNFINKFHEFIGGGISPGLEMRLKSLNQFTAKLPLVKADSNLPLIGYDTRTNILSGVVLGMAKEIDGFVDAYKEKYRNFNVLLTGGDIGYLGYHFKSKIFADPDLIFKGLYAISEVNNP